MRHIIRSASVVLPREIVVLDVVIEGGQIVDVDPARSLRCSEETDATGLFLLPGVIDDQVHFREPGLTHKEDLGTGSAACARGGITSFLEMPNTNPATTTCERLQAKIELAATKSLVNFGFFIGATPTNLDQLQTARRTPGIKIFVGSSTGDLLVDDQAALEHIFAESTLPITAHCEDETTICENRVRLGTTSDVAQHSAIRDERAAMIATQRILKLAKRHQHRFHLLHVSSGAETGLLGDHQRLITAEVCPHHLFFNTEDYAELGSLVQANPSIKSEEDNRQLWEALQKNTIQVIATDHAPHTLEEKRQPYPESPSGIPCVENVLSLMLDQVNQGRCTLNQLANWMCDAPARVWDMVGKGRIEVGYDADLVLVDLDREHTILNKNQITKCGWTPWHGKTVTGSVVSTWVNGQIVYANGEIDRAARGTEIQFDHARGGYWASCS